MHEEIAEQAKELLVSKYRCCVSGVYIMEPHPFQETRGGRIYPGRKWRRVSVDTYQGEQRLGLCIMWHEGVDMTPAAIAEAVATLWDRLIEIDLHTRWLPPEAKYWMTPRGLLEYDDLLEEEK